jgi:prepilin-type N-terminal cleavage/methylation domain-containing protein
MPLRLSLYCTTAPATPAQVDDAGAVMTRSPRRRAGFTMIEILTVLAIASLVMVMTFRPLTRAFSSSERNNAKRKVAAYIFRARATAVSRGQKTWFIRTGNTMKVLVDSSGVKVPVGQSVDLLQAHNVTFWSSPLDTIVFDPRGFAVNIPTVERYTLSRDGRLDTICVLGLGKVRTGGC